MWTYCTFKNLPENHIWRLIAGLFISTSGCRLLDFFYFWLIIGWSEAGGGTRWLKLCQCCFVADVYTTVDDLCLPNERIRNQKCYFHLKTWCSTHLKPLTWVYNLANPTCTSPPMHRGGPELLFLSAIGNDGALIGNVGFQDIISLASWIYPSSSDSSGILKAVPGILTYSKFLRHHTTEKMI